MIVDINYWWVGALIVAIVLLITWLIRNDRKDEQEFRKEIIQSEIKPERHQRDKDPDVTS
ncbi:hypothetical protein [Mucilaginibacter sp. dw_454]|uniref:hypothetical protein n=1 Tax=Mucilaginibacter sp. dw_454 TaxID=2720079 RepID=UPI001BD5EFE4|nr:hypothetical protein [Mucilaginibacter sp. dw_454]